MLAGAATGLGALVAGCLDSLGSDSLADAEDGRGLVVDGELMEIDFVSCDQDRFSVATELFDGDQGYYFYVEPPSEEGGDHGLLLVDRSTDERYTASITEGDDFAFELGEATTGEATVDGNGSGSIDVRWDLAC